MTAMPDAVFYAPITAAKVRWWVGEVDRFGARVDTWQRDVDALERRINAALSDHRKEQTHD